MVIIHDRRLSAGTNFCKCSACGAYFGGVAAFDLHRRGKADRSCLPPSVIADRHGRPLLKLNAKGFWVRAYGKAADTPETRQAAA